MSKGIKHSIHCDKCIDTTCNMYKKYERHYKSHNDGHCHECKRYKRICELHVAFCNDVKCEFPDCVNFCQMITNSIKNNIPDNIYQYF